MRDISTSPHICFVDPMTLGAAALGGVFSTLFSGGSSSSPATSPATPPPQPPPQAQPQSAAPKKQNPQSTFVGNVPTPPPSTGSKTLLGT
jgi:hypothetical protein